MELVQFNDKDKKRPSGIAMQRTLTPKPPGPRVFLDFSHTYINEGDPINFIIQVQLLSKMKIKSLKFKVLGFEEARFGVGTVKESSLRQFNYVLKDEFLVVEEGSETKKGQFAFPVSLKLPKNLPGSYNQKFNDMEFAKLEYLVAAELECEEQKGELIPHTGMRKLTAQALQKFYVVPSCKTTQIKEISLKDSLVRYCCLNQGYVVVQSQFEKDSYTLGDTAILTLSVDNRKSKVNITKIVGSLINKTQFKLKRNLSRTVESVMQSKLIAQEVIKKGEFKREIRKNVKLRTSNKKDLSDLDQSVVTDFIKNQYIFKIEIFFESCCGRDIRTIYQLLNLSKPSSAFKKETFDPPQFWNPEVRAPLVVEAKSLYEPFYQDMGSSLLMIKKEMNDMSGGGKNEDGKRRMSKSKELSLPQDSNQSIEYHRLTDA